MSEKETDLAKVGARMLERAGADARQEFGSFFLSRFFGFEVSYPDDHCAVSFEVLSPMMNPQGTLHGGVLATALDISMGHLLQHVAGAGATLEMKVQYLAPVTQGRVTCLASFLRQGRGVTFIQSIATRPDGEAIAHATATWKLLKTA